MVLISLLNYAGNSCFWGSLNFKEFVGALFLEVKMIDF